MPQTDMPPPTRAHWRNRIVGEGEQAAGQFLANEANWRLHPRFQQDAIKGVLAEVGYVQRVVVNRRSDPSWGPLQHVETLVDGHLRVASALDEGEDVLVPFVYVDLLPHEEKIILATFDPISALAGTDTEKLKELLAGASVQDAKLGEMLAALQQDKPESALKKLARGDASAPRQMDQQSGAGQCLVVITCSDETAQRALLDRFLAEGLECRALNS